MIGNKIKYRRYVEWRYEFEEAEGVVVDAWTEIEAKVKGDVFLGFGDTKGNINSKRMYKVEAIYTYTGVKYYNDVPASRLIEILEYVNKEKEPV